MKPFTFCAFTLLVPAIAATAAPQAKTPAKAPRGTAIIADVRVVGLPAEASRRRVTRELARKLNHRVRLTDGKRAVALTRRQLGVRPDLNWMRARVKAGWSAVPVHWAVDVRALQKTIRRLAPRFEVNAQDARVGEWKGKIVITPGHEARRVDAGVSAQRLARDLEQNAGLSDLKLAVKTSAPKIGAQTLRGINGRLSVFPTKFNAGNIKRTLNMRIAIRAIDGTILAPGQVFSLNDVVGDRTQARGYRTAIIFKNGYKVAGIGGGVSQVTGTLFNAALLAGLPIVEYQTHSRPVAYLPIGRDATVSYGNFDMKFKNNTAAPLYISYKLAGDQVTATIYGKTVPGQHVKPIVRFQRQGPRSIKAQLYRVIRRNGKVVAKEKLGDSSYDWQEQKND